MGARQALPDPSAQPAGTTDPEDLAAMVLDSAFATFGSFRETLHREQIAGLTMAQFRTLIVLREEQPASLSTMAERMHLSPAAASRLVDGMVARGLLSRVTSSQDRRRIDLRLTDSGQRVLLDADRLVVQFVAARLAELEPREQAAVRDSAAILSRLFGGKLSPFSAAARSRGAPE